jgi:hypothetical protein
MLYRIESKPRRVWARWWYVLPLAAVAIALIVGLAYYRHQTAGPVPKGIAKAVTIPVYYPEPKKLPPSYVLDTSSFSIPVKNGVTYSVNYGSGKKLIFSLQPKPSDDELQSFKGNYLPLKIDYHTAIGMAQIGAYHSQTLVSLPVDADGGPWIIVTAPVDVSQSQLKQVLSALKI